MYSGCDLLLCDDPPQQRGQSLAFGLVERAEQIVFKLAGDIENPLQASLSRGGQVQVMTAPVGRIASPGDELLLLELVKQNYEAAGKDSEELGDRLLSHSRIGSEHAQYAHMLRRELDGGQTLFEASGGVEADL